MVKRRKIFSSGLGVIELVVATAIIITTAVSIFAVAHFSLLAQRTATLERRAALAASEGLAVTRFEREANWTTFSALPLATNLYPTFSGSSANLSTIDPGPVDGIFTRIVTLSNVYRNGSGDIVSSGTLDVDARKVTVSVSWTDPFGKTITLTIDTYLMKLS